MTVAAWTFLALALAGSAYQLFGLAAVIRFFVHARRRWAGLPDYTPPVTVLKPLKGPGIDLFANLESFCRQDYPHYQIVFGVADADDPAVDVVRRLQRAFPDRDITLAIGERAAVNAKVGNLMHMTEHAKHDVLVLSDGDIRVRPDYLRTIVRPLQEPRVGLSTCLYRGRGQFGLPSVVESLLINTDFVPMALIGNWIGIRTAYGASIAIRREALDAIGGFRAIANHLADDFMLGNGVARAGYELAVLPYVVETILDSTSLRDVWRHQLRWARTYRTVEPVGWMAALVTFAITWSVLLWLVTGGGPVATRVLLAALGCRVLLIGTLTALLRERETPLYFWLIPLKDVAVSVIWLVSWLGREVEWSGRRFRVESDGRLTPLSRDASLAHAPEPQSSP
jgi:ceramide glucosyltransferase